MIPLRRHKPCIIQKKVKTSTAALLNYQKFSPSFCTLKLSLASEWVAGANPHLSI